MNIQIKYFVYLIILVKIQYLSFNLVPNFAVYDNEQLTYR